MIPSGIMEAVFSVALVVAGWLIKHGFITVNRTLEKISETLNQAVNRVGQLETWAKHREKTDDERHSQNQKAIDELKDSIKQRRRK